VVLISEKNYPCANAGEAESEAPGVKCSFRSSSDIREVLPGRPFPASKLAGCGLGPAGEDRVRAVAQKVSDRPRDDG
jgi:hypothetical protein